ncbi:methylenetetrahydrofolate reductase C-terminal domain-containing protein [Subtercola sp. YIM 133946]|uniref:methylenetetrahydrofolate reductase C-terminal domain-containing protein n=1 Tax=Subtercola sp. YIM 133946 TaxID=3118909 RepID=UPI002F948AA2
MHQVIDQAFSCPKHMTFGPCGGVKFDGTCEVAEERCVFVDSATVRWGGAPGGAERQWRGEVDGRLPQGAHGGVAERLAPEAQGGVAERLAQTMRERQIVVGDFAARAVDVASAEECAGIMRGSVDAALSGDSGAARVQFAPTFRAELIQDAGLAAFIGLNCRDRNRVAIEGELAGLAAVGASAVHCVTGDHTLTGQRPDALPVFDLDSTRVAARAAAAGLLVSVGEAPATPPVERRAERLVEKQRAGARIAFVNHCGGAHPVARFIAEVRRLEQQEALGGLGFIACVPMVVDRGSAELLASFTTLVLPPGYLERILGARDVYAEGVAAAVELSDELLAQGGVVGVNLSGGPAAGGEAAFAEATARVASRVSLRRFGADHRVPPK